MMAGEEVSSRPDISSSLATERDAFVSEIDRRNRRWFEQRTESVEAWAADRQTMLRAQVAEAEYAVAEKRKAARTASTLPEQVRLQGEVRKLQAALEEAEDQFRLARKEVARERDKVLDEAASRLQQTVVGREIFAIRWHVV